MTRYRVLVDATEIEVECKPEADFDTEDEFCDMSLNPAVRSIGHDSDLIEDWYVVNDGNPVPDLHALALRASHASADGKPLELTADEWDALRHLASDEGWAAASQQLRDAWEAALVHHRHEPGSLLNPAVNDLVVIPARRADGGGAVSPEAS